MGVDGAFMRPQRDRRSLDRMAVLQASLELTHLWIQCVRQVPAPPPEQVLKDQHMG